MDMLRIPQQPQLPVNPRPIVMIGAGGIVRDAHLLAYRKALFPVSSICDLQIDRARHLATEYGIAATLSDFKQAIASAPGNAVFDLALPPKALPSVLDERHLREDAEEYLHRTTRHKPDDHIARLRE
jgi:hypothetical protein